MNIRFSHGLLAAVALIGVTSGCNRAPQKTYSSLYLAAHAGDLAAVKKMVESGADINESGPKKMTPLMAGLVSQNQSLVDYLLEKGAKTDSVDERGWNIVHFAASNNNVKMLKLLDSKGMDLNTLTVQDNASAYQLAKSYNQEDAAKWLKDKGVDTTMRTLTGPSRSGGI